MDDSIGQLYRHNSKGDNSSDDGENDYFCLNNILNYVGENKLLRLVIPDNAQMALDATRIAHNYGYSFCIEIDKDFSKYEWAVDYLLKRNHD